MNPKNSPKAIGQAILQVISLCGAYLNPFASSNLNTSDRLNFLTSLTIIISFVIFSYFCVGILMCSLKIVYIWICQTSKLQTNLKLKNEKVSSSSLFLLTCPDPMVLSFRKEYSLTMSRQICVNWSLIGYLKLFSTWNKYLHYELRQMLILLYRSLRVDNYSSKNADYIIHIQ
jgi:hypothetical protein